MLQRTWIVAAGGLAVLFLPAVHGHAYIKESRQYYNSKAYQDDDYADLEGNPGAYNSGGQQTVQERAIELTDPDLLAEYGDGLYPLRWVYDKGELAPNGNFIEPPGISVRHGLCGDPKTIPKAARVNGVRLGDIEYTTPNKDWPILQEFTQGQVMKIEAVMQIWHWGHYEFFLCDTKDLDDPDGVVTQECFNKYPLTRAEDDGVNSPIDPNHPGRYYPDPPCRENETEQEKDERVGGGHVVTMHYQLPADLTCERCVLQSWYFTGHKCRVPGYEEFNPPSWPSECAPNKEDWIDLSVPKCGDERWYVPEEFWQCSDIAIKPADGLTSPTAPSPTAAVGEEVDAEYIGCFHDDRGDRLLGDKLDDSNMTTKMCFDHCTDNGAAFMATQWGFECWCSSDGGLDYNRHYEMKGEEEAVCDMPCMGDKTEICGGYDSFELYKLPG